MRAFALVVAVATCAFNAGAQALELVAFTPIGSQNSSYQNGVYSGSIAFTAVWGGVFNGRASEAVTVAYQATGPYGASESSGVVQGLFTNGTWQITSTASGQVLLAGDLSDGSVLALDNLDLRGVFSGGGSPLSGVLLAQLGPYNATFLDLSLLATAPLTVSGGLINPFTAAVTAGSLQGFIVVPEPSPRALTFAATTTTAVIAGRRRYRRKRRR